jgi:hypothetical protein
MLSLRSWQFFVFNLAFELKGSGRFKTKNATRTGQHFCLAESGGFEPADPLTSQQFSRLPQSTTLPTLRDKSTNTS